MGLVSIEFVVTAGPDNHRQLSSRATYPSSDPAGVSATLSVRKHLYLLDKIKSDDGEEPRKEKRDEVRPIRKYGRDHTNGRIHLNIGSRQTSMARAQDNANVFEQALCLVPGGKPLINSPLQANNCRVSQLVSLVDRKIKSCNLNRDMSILQDHMVMRSIVDAADMQEAKQGLEHAAKTLKVELSP